MTDALLQFLPWVAVAVLSLCLGSFANVLIWRLPRDQQVIKGRSHCPHCQRTIPWYENIPLVSWLALGGRCRGCGGAIAWRYPVVELASGLIAVGCLWWFGPTESAVAAFVFLYLLGVIAIIDWEHMIIPHTLSVTGMIAGLAFSPWSGLGLGASILGLVIGGGSVWLLSEGYRLVRGQAGMGGGDVMLMGMVGAFLGPWAAAAVLGAGALLGTLYVLARGGGRLQGTAKLPFGTFLAAGAAVVMLAGPALWTWYVGFLT
jgi:leader peptidase (prepilin peptidase)/N-methyltransferase